MKKSEAQKPKNLNDTLQYLQTQIMDRKEVYLNKVFSVLLDSLKIPCLSYSFNASNRPGEVPGILLFFIKKNEATILINDHVELPVLIVTWRDPVPLDSVLAVFKKSKGEWLQTETLFYGPRIVKELYLKGK